MFKLVNEMLEKFWGWYEKNEVVNTGVAAGLFTLQIVHLYWLTSAVVLTRLIGRSLFTFGDSFELVITLVDYTEIPAIVATSLLYISDLRKKFSYRSLWFLFFINSQWLHIFWITDEFVLENFTNYSATTLLPVWLAWVAIFIDYLELPVIYDTVKRFVNSYRMRNFESALEDIRQE